MAGKLPNWFYDVRKGDSGGEFRVENGVGFFTINIRMSTRVCLLIVQTPRQQGYYEQYVPQQSMHERPHGFVSSDLITVLKPLLVTNFYIQGGREITSK
jgi:hypothetical protein